VTSTEVSQRVAVHALLVEIPTAVVVVANSLDPSMGEGGLQADLDMTSWTEAKSLEPKVARILLEAVAATWEVHRVWESSCPLWPGCLATVRSL
jgi:hypothetical protein